MKQITTPNAAATQTEHPVRAAVRTFIQAWLPLLALFVLVVPPIVDIVFEEFARAGVEPPGWLRLALAGAATGCALTAAIVARIMAIPRVEQLLREVDLGAAPKNTAPPFALNYAEGAEVGSFEDADEDPDAGLAAPDADTTVLEDTALPPAGESPGPWDRPTEVDQTPPAPGWEPRH